MSVYASDILAAAVAFPFMAAALTLPFMIYHYRTYGSIPWLRTLAVYSFVFYLMCAYFLVILPLPADHAAVVPYAQTPQLVPFNFVREIMAGPGLSPTQPSTWLDAARNPAVYEAIFNLLLTVPLGMYLRYYFRRTWWQTLAIGFLTTLFFEMSQLTGLFGLYAHPYRLFDVDDLLINTLGAMVGFWLVGPMMRVLPDVRLVSEEAREAGMRASTTRRALSFALDVSLAQALAGTVGSAAEALGAKAALVGGSAMASGGPATAATSDAIASGGSTLATIGGSMLSAMSNGEASWGIVLTLIEYASFALAFGVVPALTRGQTLGQKLLRLRIVRPDATPARWYQYFARYGLLFLFAWVPFAVLFGLVALEPASAPQAGAMPAFATSLPRAFGAAWALFLLVWAATLVVRAARCAMRKTPFVMLNGLLSNTRVMTEAGIARARELRCVLDVRQVTAWEQRLAQSGTSLAELMTRAGGAVAEAVRTRVADPAPVVVLAGSGNNGGDGWVAAHLLAKAGYPVVLVAPDLAERVHAEPARTAAMRAFADASAHDLPLRVLIAPEADVLDDALENARGIVDAMLGTGFSGDEVREPYASWIEAANRRRFEGARGKGRGRHRKRTKARGSHERFARRAVPLRAKDAPFAVAADVPSGLSAQTGTAARPCFAADLTVAMLAYKPGLVSPGAARWTGALRLARLVEEAPPEAEDAHET